MIERKAKLSYQVGTVLYTPALYEVSEDLFALPGLGTLAFCLEDTIRDEALEQAEEQLLKTFEKIRAYLESGGMEKATDEGASGMEKASMPLVFVRIRGPEHMRKVYQMLGERAKYLTGFVLPKYSLKNAVEYGRVLGELQASSDSRPVYAMPILESPDIANKESRMDTLLELRRHIRGMGDKALYVRVGGNDFCQLFGVRRGVGQTIYDIGVIRDILIDILNVFGREYLVSAPVWEYYDNGKSEAWEKGLEKELEFDILNGFTGKTAIHPSQIATINHRMKVSQSDYMDALQILNWDNESLGVLRSAGAGRMNEVKVHEAWARRMMGLAQGYGIGEGSGRIG